MGKYLKRRWIAEHVSGLPRSERRACEYSAYIPDCLMGREFLLTGATAADVADAETAIARLDSEVKALTNTEALARLLLRAESVASSRIEGLEIGPRRLMRAEAARQAGELPADIGAEDVLGNIDAMQKALQLAEAPEEPQVNTILEVHRALLAGTRMSEHAGKIRAGQNWIGGSAYNPCSAVFVPPPPGDVLALLEDLCAFCATDMLSPVVQAAIAHAQFETIHPFADGNGRTGRALIHMILRRRGLAAHVQPPISLILATRSREYIDGLGRFRYEGDPDSEAARDGLNAWIATFASACTRAVDDALNFEQRCGELDLDWRSRLGRVRAGSSVDLLLRALPGTPIITVKSAMDAVGRSKPQVNAAVRRLEEAGILSQLTIGRRNRAFEAREVIDAFTGLERRLASGVGDTQMSAPVRAVPARPRRRR